MNRRLMGLSLIACMSLTGCSNSTSDFRSIPLEAQLTKQEVIDYYAKEMSYDSIVTRHGSYVTDLVFTDVSEEKKEILTKRYQDVIKQYKANLNKKGELSKNSDVTVEAHEYLKCVLDNFSLGDENIKSIQESLGYYFVTVDFNVGANNYGKLKNMVNYLGVNGVFTENDKYEITLDEKYLTRLLSAVDKRRKEEGLESLDVSDKNDEIESVIKGGLDDESSDESEDTGTEEDDTEASENNGNEEDDTEASNVKPSSVKYETTNIDIAYINDTVGTSKSSAVMPNLNEVFKSNNDKDTLSGYGIYNQGKNGLSSFGYNSEDVQGKIELVFVFKQDYKAKSNCKYEFCYINNYQSNIDLESKVENKPVFGEFITKELNKVVERYDRVINNKDLKGIMEGGILEDKKMQLVNAFYTAHSDIMTYMSKIRDVIARSEDGKVYLVRLERLVEESSLKSSSIVKYKDEYYAVIRQDGTSFKINDYVMISRSALTEPDINADESSKRRLVSLNLSGEISENDKNEIQEQINNLYTAVNIRQLYDTVETNDDTGEETFYPGVYDRFDTDRVLLTASKFDYLTSQVTGRSTRETAKVGCKYAGVVSQWMGGNDNQAEFITEEVMTYDGKTKGLYLKQYYLMSNYNGKWVIDDIVNIQELELSGRLLKDKMDAIGGEQAEVGDLNFDGESFDLTENNTRGSTSSETESVGSNESNEDNNKE